MYLLSKSQKRLADWRILPGATAVLVLLMLAISAAFSENAAPAYLFKQKSQIQGQTEILVSSIGVKMTLVDRHLVIFMRPPLWHVQFCDLRGKRYFECTKETFREPLARTIGMTKPSSASHLKVKSSKSSVYMGIPCRTFELLDPFPSNEKRETYWEKIAIRSAIAGGYEEAPAKIFGRVFCRVYAMPEFDAVPINILLTNYRGESFPDLETVSAKKLTVKAADFVVPAAYAQVSSASNVASENNVDTNLGELFK